MPFRKGRISHLSDPYVSTQMELCRELSGKADAEHPCAVGSREADGRQTLGPARHLGGDTAPRGAPRVCARRASLSGEGMKLVKEKQVNR